MNAQSITADVAPVPTIKATIDTFFEMPHPGKRRTARREAQDLSDVELLSWVLDGNSAVSPLHTARVVLASVGDLQSLAHYDMDALLMTPGIDHTNVLKLLATLELMRRLARNRVERTDVIEAPEQLVRYLRLKYAELDQESMGAVFLSADNHMLGDAEMFRGTLGRIAVEPRPILRRALLKRAPKVMLFHTHPSNSHRPSSDDIEFTLRFAKASEAVGIGLLEHLIITPNGGWTALSRRMNW